MQVPVGSTVELKPFNNPTFTNTKSGKEYEITFIKRRIGGESGTWEEIDLKNLTEQEIMAFVEAAERVSTAMDRFNSLPGPLHSFTLNFKEHGPDKDPFLLDRVTYFETKDASEKTFSVNLKRYDDQTQEWFLMQFRPLNQVISHVFERTVAAKAALNTPQPPVNMTGLEPDEQDPQPRVEELDDEAPAPAPAPTGSGPTIEVLN